MAEGVASITVLIVEDEFLIRMLAIDAIMEAGYAVEAAANAGEAIAALEQNPSIRIVFTDVTMPGSMDGLKLAHYIRGRWPPIKLIVTSGRPDPFRRAPPGALFLPKPYSLAAVIETLGRLSSGSPS